MTISRIPSAPSGGFLTAEPRFIRGEAELIRIAEVEARHE
jgi:hypothetical protein